MPISLTQFALAMKRPLAISLAAAIGFSMVPNTVSAQSDRQLVKQFRDGFERGCNQGKTEGVSNQRRYCNCMANSFQNRYTGKELSAISQAATGLGNNGPSIVNLMMAPEARACNAKY